MWPMKLVLATRNAGKIAEIKHLLEGADIELDSLLDHSDVADVVEDGETFIDNARKKAHAAARAFNAFALADDSGLVVKALGGEPGVKSARYAGGQGDYRANNEKLLHEMDAVPDGRRQAAFVCVIVLAAPDGREWVAEGRCEGEIIREYRGSNGFGFDPLFYLPGENATMAELPMDRKNAISHRGRALSQMKKILVEILQKEKQ